MAKTKILVVDDEKEICEITKSFLCKRNYECFTASCEGEALDLVRKEHPIIALLDMRLGDASGIDVLRKIKEIDETIKVIMVTALNDAQAIQDAKSYGADDYITKPFTANFLDDLLSKKI